MSLFLLFLSAFGAATLLPLQSEAVLLGLLVQASHSVALLIAVASLGNIWVPVSTGIWGLKSSIIKIKNGFRVKDKMLKAQMIYQKYGYWSLLLSWVPIIGDPITLIAATERKLSRFLLIVSLAKIGRYLFIYAAFALF